MNNNNVCPSDCSESLLLPALPADPFCLVSPDYSQVAMLVIAPCESEDPFALAEGDVILSTTAINNANTDNTAPRLLVVQGGVDEHEPVVYDGPFRRQIISQRGFTLTASISLADNTVYRFLQFLQCNPNFRFWYIDVANWGHGPVAVEGSIAGLTPSLVNVQMPKGAGRDDLQKANIIIQWEDKGDPIRWESPLTATTACEPPEPEVIPD
jgi:hypothetical protein